MILGGFVCESEPARSAPSHAPIKTGNARAVQFFLCKKRPRKNKQSCTPPIAAKKTASRTPVSTQEKNVATFFVFDIFDRFSFNAGRQYALDVFQSRGDPALRLAPKSRSQSTNWCLSRTQARECSSVTRKFRSRVRRPI